MCTLSFIPRERGYSVAMNRDELFTRPCAKVASVHAVGGQSAIFPEDGERKTWIAVNQSAITLALLNWSTPPQGEKQRSRGDVIPALIGQSSLKNISDELAKLNMAGMRPFRLVGLFDEEQAVREWRWDGVRVQTLESDWERQHWFSSGLSDEKATASRRVVASELSAGRSVGMDFQSLRRLHSSHLPERGAFSVCVHREDAASQSYTEVEAGIDSVQMRYRDGSPCLREGFDAELVLPRVSQSSQVV